MGTNKRSKAATRLTPELEAKILETLNSEEWKNRSTNAISAHLQLSYKIIRTVRTKHNLKPKRIELEHGGQMRAGHIGTDKGRQEPLTIRERQRMEEAEPMVQRLARGAANGTLSYDQLIDVAHDTIEIAARKWDPSEGRGWMTYAGNGIRMAIKQAFWRRRQQLEVERVFSGDDCAENHIDEKFEDDRRAFLRERIRGLPPLPRLICEKIILLASEGCQSKKPETLAKEVAMFWDRSLEWANRQIEIARQLLLQGDSRE
jgi:hypothetical protein